MKTILQHSLPTASRTSWGPFLPPWLLAFCLLFTACINIDKQVASRPSELWKPPSQARSHPHEDSDQKKTANQAETATSLLGKGPVGLPILIDIALENNPSTRSSWFAAKTVAAQYGQSLSSYYPDVTLNTSITRVKMENEYFANSNVYRTTYGPTLSINWLLFNFGAREALADAAREALYAANFDYNQTYQDVVLNVITAYFNLDAAIATLEATEALLINSEATYESARKKLESGLGTKQDTLRALANVKSAEAQLQQNGASIEQARADLASTIGIQVGAYLKIIPPSEPPSFEGIDADVSKMLALALQNRPAILSAYATVREADANLTAAQGGIWPQLTSGASAVYNRSDSNGFDTIQNYQAFIQVEWHLFDGFNNTYGLRGLRSQARQARQTLRAQELNILSQVWTDYFAFHASLRQVEANQTAVNAQQEAYEAIELGYQSGINGLLDLLTAQQDLNTAQQNLVQSKASRSNSIANLAYAIGALPRVALQSAASVNAEAPPADEDGFWQTFFGDA